MTPLGEVPDESAGPPDWYGVLRAAKYLNVAPWELLHQPVYWQHWAIAAESAENAAEHQRMEREKSRSKIKGAR